MLVKCVNKEIDIKIGLEFNKYYIVMGVEIYLTDILFLIADSQGSPLWASKKYFDVIDNSLPKGYSIQVNPQKTLCDTFYIWSDVLVLIGYSKLLESANHYAKLIERESQDIKYFNNIYLDILNKYYLEYAFPPPNLELRLDFPEPQLSFRG